MWLLFKSASPALEYENILFSLQSSALGKR
jgi:hypothetical protein